MINARLNVINKSFLTHNGLDAGATATVWRVKHPQIGDIGLTSSRYDLRFFTTMRPLILLAFIMMPLCSRAQLDGDQMHRFWNQGLPHITNYTSQDYKASLQNWVITQNNDGIIYVGNSSGILEYDGATWRLIKTPLGAPVKSVAKHPSGRIYVGGVNEIGYLHHDPAAGTVYRSLLDQLDSTSRRFNDVWFSYAIGNDIYFVTDTHILRWADNKFTVWKGLTIGFSWLIRDKLYAHVEGQGLIQIDGERMIPVKEAEKLFKDHIITMLLANGEDGFLAITNKNEFYRLKGSEVTRMPHTLPSGFAYNAVTLKDGSHVLASLNGGLYFLDNNGVVTRRLTKKDGLNTDTIIGIFIDAEGDIWLAGDNSLSRVELNSATRIFNHHVGVDEDIDAIASFNNELYITTVSGLYYLHPDPQQDDRWSFTKVKGVDFQTFFISVIGDQLIACNFYGLYTVDKDHQVTKLATGNFQVTGSPSITDDYILFALADSSVGELIRQGKSWRFGKHKVKIEGRPNRIWQLENGNIFISTRYNGVYEIRWPDGSAQQTLSDDYSMIHYDTLCGLPSLTMGALSIVNQTIHIPTMENGVYIFDKQTDRFTPATSTGPLFQQNDVMAGTPESAGDNDYWLPVYRNYETTVYKYQNDSIRKVNALSRASNLVIESIYDTHTGIVLLGSDQGLIAFDAEQPDATSNTFGTLVRKINLNKDSTIFAGHGHADHDEFQIDYKNNNLSFEFSLPSYDLSRRNEFQYFLEGFDNKWSDWSTTSRVDFTNLGDGTYTFHVRGRNVYGKIAKAATFPFSITPPMHRTWWAYILYSLAGTGIVLMIVQWRSSSLQKDKQALEQMIRDRTEKITMQSEKLKELDKAKSRFYANISHEFRTPLTLILAPLDEEIRKRSDHDKERLRLLKRNAERLLELVNQLLDLSKLDAGKMDLRVKKHNLLSFIRIIAASFESLADSKNIRFARHISLGAEPAWFDQDKLEKIITNILVNAFKFTRPGTEVAFDAATTVQDGAPWLLITISDSGDGIPEDEQSQIFSPFYQTRQASDGQESGTGLGLSLVKELVTLHKGHIHLSSREGIGTAFYLEIPIGRNTFDVQDADTEETDIVSAFHTAHDADEPDTVTERFGSEIEEDKDTLVIVEDNADLRSFISSILQSRFTVHQAQNGEDGLALTLQKVPNLVLTDLMMPRLDGLQLTEKIKRDERTSHIPVILLTARNESRSRIDGLKLGADDYLTKPFSPEELIARITNLIDQRKRLSVLFRERILVNPTTKREQSLDDKFLLKVRALVENNMADTALSVESLSAEMAMSRTQLLRKLKALTGLSPNEFIKDLRLKKAADLIRQKTDTITQVGFSVGFNDQSYFTKCFKKQYGVTPKEFAQS